ncbi:MAG: radical SAM protein [Verrucomicrobiota bacterium]
MPTLELGSILSQPREFLGNQFVYAVITSRARGLSIGVNMNPDQRCNFDCPFCEVKRVPEKATLQLDLKTLTHELTHVVAMAQSGRLREVEQFSRVPADLLVLKEVALSGDGEPTLLANFDEVVREVLQVRQLLAPFKMVLITNGTGLHRPAIQRGLALLDQEDEIWIKLDAGTEAFMREINGTTVQMSTVLHNILELSRRRPVVIQSLFCMLDNEPPSENELTAYIQRLEELKAGGAQISLVQIYSISRPPGNPRCKHLPLARLSQIARRVRAATGLNAEVF